MVAMCAYFAVLGMVESLCYFGCTCKFSRQKRHRRFSRRAFKHCFMAVLMCNHVLNPLWMPFPSRQAHLCKHAPFWLLPHGHLSRPRSLVFIGSPGSILYSLVLSRSLGSHLTASQSHGGVNYPALPGSAIRPGCGSGNTCLTHCRFGPGSLDSRGSTCLHVLPIPSEGPDTHLYS